MKPDGDVFHFTFHWPTNLILFQSHTQYCLYRFFIHYNQNTLKSAVWYFIVFYMKSFCDLLKPQLDVLFCFYMNYDGVRRNISREDQRSKKMWAKYSKVWNSNTECGRRGFPSIDYSFFFLHKSRQFFFEMFYISYLASFKVWVNPVPRSALHSIWHKGAQANNLNAQLKL